MRSLLTAATLAASLTFAAYAAFSPATDAG
jgi:hypothetical protein